MRWQNDNPKNSWWLTFPLMAHVFDTRLIMQAQVQTGVVKARPLCRQKGAKPEKPHRTSWHLSFKATLKHIWKPVLRQIITCLHGHRHPTQNAAAPSGRIVACLTDLCQGVHRACGFNMFHQATSPTPIRHVHHLTSTGGCRSGSAGHP